MRRGSSLKQTKFWRKVRDVDAGKHDTADALACEESLMAHRALKFGASSTR